MEVKIIPTGGLCNRLRAIATGVAVAKSYHCPSVIYWNNSLGLKADYCELFKPIPQEDVKLVENKQWLYNINGNKDYLIRWPLLKTMFEKIVFNFSIYRDGEIYSKLKMSYSRSLLLISCYPMCTKYTIQGMFIPQDDIQRRIDEVVAGFYRCTYPQNRQCGFHSILSIRELYQHDGCGNQEESQYQVLCSQR